MCKRTERQTDEELTRGSDTDDHTEVWEKHGEEKAVSFDKTNVWFWWKFIKINSKLMGSL